MGVDDKKKWMSDKHRGKSAVAICSQDMDAGSCADAMAQEIYTNGPITGMFFVHQSFFHYQSGVYHQKLIHAKDPMVGAHAVKIIGFGDDPKRGKYWLAANSWNSEWGDEGFFKIRRGTNDCQIENPLINGGPIAGEPQL